MPALNGLTLKFIATSGFPVFVLIGETVFESTWLTYNKLVFGFKYNLSGDIGAWNIPGIISSLCPSIIEIEFVPKLAT